MSQQPSRGSADGVTFWENAVHRAEQGNAVLGTAHTEEVSDAVPSDELDRRPSTSDSLSDLKALS